MNLDAVELLVVRLPLVRPFVTAHGSTAQRDVLLVHVTGEDGEGWGECGADTTPAYWWETVSSAQKCFPSIARGERGRRAIRWRTPRSRWQCSTPSSGSRTHRSLPTSAQRRDRVIATATAGFDDDVESFVAAGYRSIKVKVTPERALSSETIPEGVSVQVDANGSYASDPGQRPRPRRTRAARDRAAARSARTSRATRSWRASCARRCVSTSR